MLGAVLTIVAVPVIVMVFVSVRGARCPVLVQREPCRRDAGAKHARRADLVAVDCQAAERASTRRAATRVEQRQASCHQMPEKQSKYRMRLTGVRFP